MQNIHNGNIVSIQVGPLCCDNEVMSIYVSKYLLLATFMTTYADIYILRQNGKLFEVIWNSKHGVAPNKDSQHYNLTLF